MRPPPRLSNCYTPLPRQAAEDGTTFTNYTTRSTQRQRPNHQLRPLQLTSERISSKDSSSSSVSSAFVKLGNTQVMCRVEGPVTSTHPSVPSSITLDMDRGTLIVDVQYGAFAYPIEHILLQTATSLDQAQPQQRSEGNAVSSFLSQRESYVAAKVFMTLEPAIPWSMYPKNAILVHISVLQDDGSIVAAAITAASIALARSSLEMYDIPCACQVAIVHDKNDNKNDDGNQTKDDSDGNTYKKQYQVLADPTLQEEIAADSTIVLGMLSQKDVACYEQMGRKSMALDVMNPAIELARDGCRTMHKFARTHLIEQYHNSQRNLS